MRIVSFMIVAGGLYDGKVRGDGKAEAYEVLRPYIVTEEQVKAPKSFLHLHLQGPEIKADIGLFEEAMTAERFGGDRVCDLLVEAARAADWVILPPGSPTCITRESQREHLPPELAEHVVFVKSGQDLIEAFDIEV